MLVFQIKQIFALITPFPMVSSFVQKCLASPLEIIHTHYDLVCSRQCDTSVGTIVGKMFFELNDSINTLILDRTWIRQGEEWKVPQRTLAQGSTWDISREGCACDHLGSSDKARLRSGIVLFFLVLCDEKHPMLGKQQARPSFILSMSHTSQRVSVL